MRGRVVAFVLAVAVIAAVGFWLNRGSSPLLGPADSCTTRVGEVTVGLDPEQSRNATLMAAIGIRRGLPARAVSIAIATSMQESKLHNLDHGDRDSLGLFQQRPSQGWGTAQQIRNPVYSINAFYDVLGKVQGFSAMPITEAAQQVQRSAYPDAYAAHESQARAVASALTGYSMGGQFTCVVNQVQGPGSFDAVAQAVRRGYGAADVQHGARQDVLVNVGPGAGGRRLGWSVAAYLLTRAKPLGIRSVTFDQHVWSSGSLSQRGWRSSPAGHQAVRVSLG